MEADGGTAARSSGEAEVEAEVEQEEGAEVAACSWLQGGPRISPATWPHMADARKVIANSLGRGRRGMYCW